MHVPWPIDPKSGRRWQPGGYHWRPAIPALIAQGFDTFRVSPCRRFHQQDRRPQLHCDYEPAPNSRRRDLTSCTRLRTSACTFHRAIGERLEIVVVIQRCALWLRSLPPEPEIPENAEIYKTSPRKGAFLFHLPETPQEQREALYPRIPAFVCPPCPNDRVGFRIAASASHHHHVFLHRSAACRPSNPQSDHMPSAGTVRRAAMDGRAAF